jgi:hypothetical protein
VEHSEGKVWERPMAIPRFLGDSPVYVD